MKKIDCISRLQNCGIFRDFTWSSRELPKFGLRNLIYGWNGIGKTTLSRLFRDIEQKRVPMGSIKLHVSGGVLSGEEFPQSTLQVRVFNRDFVKEIILSTVNRRDVPPIYVIGEIGVKNQKEINRLKSCLSAAAETLDSAESNKKEAKRKLENFCINCAKSVKDELRSSDYSQYNDYNKNHFKKHADEMGSEGTAYLLNEVERKKLIDRNKGASRPRVEPLKYRLPDFSAITGRVLGLLGTTVSSQAVIDILKDDRSLAEWTRKGLELHQNRRSEQCLFCEQSLPDLRLEKLRAHFSDECEQLIRSIDQEIQRMRTALEETNKIKFPSEEGIYDYLRESFLSCQNKLNEVLATVRDFSSSVIQILEDKKHQVFDEIQREFEVPVDTDVVEKLNNIIGEHNEECDAHETKVEEARDRLARDMIAKKLPEYIELKQGVSSTEATFQKNKQEVQCLNEKINSLEHEIKNHRKPAEELNEDLKKYLGHSELYLEVKETGYIIKRNEEVADALSEGETTAIALLYFLKSLQDTEFESSSGIVVLDDPVSSLDANALFLAFAFIQERTKDVGQLFILTHNFSFFRQVRSWFKHENKKSGNQSKEAHSHPAQFFMLESEVEDSSLRNSTIRRLDPLLDKYDSDYHYMFAHIYRVATGSRPNELQEYYILPNMARRMLEAFLAFRQPQTAGKLRQKMKRISFSEVKKRRILEFLNMHSHSPTVGESEHDLTALAEGPSVLRDLLSMIEELDRDHFSAMKEIVGS